MIDVKDKIVLVTGAGRGIGKHFADSFVKSGSIVIGLDKEFCLDRYDFKTLKIDLTDSKDLLLLIEDIKASYSKIDVLINCAGITIPSKNTNYSLKDWKKTLEINLDVPFILTSACKEMLSRSLNPSVINIGSLNSILAFPNNPAYVSSKTGLLGLTRALALDYSCLGIRVNCILPGYIKTDMTGESWTNTSKRNDREKRTMLGRWGTPEDLAGCALFLASSCSSYITGQSIAIDGGWSIKGL